MLLAPYRVGECRQGKNIRNLTLVHESRLSGHDNVADALISEQTESMVHQIDAYEFIDTAFVVGSDPVVCVVPLSELCPHLTLAELDEAFSGHAIYRQAPWMKRYVGVWGKKNCQRLRRFLRERGANVVIHRERPPRLGLARYKTKHTRRKVRLLAARNGS